MPQHLLEIGPGYFPLVAADVERSNWLGYLEGGAYTAVQPASHRNGCRFPDACRLLERVDLIEAPVERASLLDAHFDEVYAANVLSDPCIHKGPILEQAVRVVRPGGLLTFLENYTPDEAPTLEVLAKSLSDSCRLVEHLELTVKGNGDLSRMDFVIPTAEWAKALSAYSRDARKSLERPDRHMTTGSFTQFVKLEL